MKKLNLYGLTIVGLVAVLATMIVDVHLSLFISLGVCGLQQLRIQRSESKAMAAQSESNIYKGIVYDQLRKYKEAMFNGKSNISPGKIVQAKIGNSPSIQ